MLKNITQEQRVNLIQLINNLDKSLANQVFDEFKKRCHENTINQPVSYLFSLLRKAQNNEFKPWLTVSGGTKPKQEQITISEQAKPLVYRREVNQPIPSEVQDQIKDLKKLLAHKTN